MTDPTASTPLGQKIPPGESTFFLGRLKVLAAGALLILGVAALRVFVLTAVQGDYWLERAESNFLKPRDIPPPRGLIVDQRGEPLAINRPVFDIKVRRYGHDRAEIVQALSFLRELTDRPLLASTETVLNVRPSWRQVTLLHGLAPAEAAILLERLGAWECLEAELRYERYYPFGRATAHVLGYLRQIPPEQMERRLEMGYLRNDLVGWVGLEGGWEERLRGKRGEELYTADALARELKSEVADSASPGASLRLTLDARLQRRAHELLEAGGFPGSVVALDPRTGAVRALASWPTFDPNTRRLGPEDSAWNRPLRTPTAPASTLKIFSAVALLEAGKPADGTYWCGGYFKFPYYDHRFHCDYRGGCGHVSLERALRRSCNVFFFRGANEIGGEALRQVFERFGLGRPVGLSAQGLGIEEVGSLHAGDAALPGEVIMAAIGQGKVAVTPVQLAAALAAFANGGTWYRPFVVGEVVDAEGSVVEKGRPQGYPVALRADHRARILRGLREVVSHREGTADEVGFDPAWDVAGKTGTAERGDKTDAWFVCFAPAARPEIVLVVRVQEAGHGSEGAAPIARELLKVYFQPEQEPGTPQTRESVL